MTTKELEPNLINIANINEINDNSNQNYEELNVEDTLNNANEINEIDKPKQRVLVCVGVPGSGKSTFSKKLCQIDNVWYRVNQDDLGSRKACEDISRVQINKGKNVIVDRCNFDKEQRKTWINLAHRFNLPIDAIILDTPYEICEKRILKREDHPTQVHGINGLGILNQFRQMLVLPNYNEGFERILSVKPHEIDDCCEDDIKEIMRKFDEIVIRQDENEGGRGRGRGWRRGWRRGWGRGWGDRGRAMSRGGRGNNNYTRGGNSGGGYIRGNRGRGNNYYNTEFPSLG